MFGYFINKAQRLRNSIRYTLLVYTVKRVKGEIFWNSFLSVCTLFNTASFATPQIPLCRKMLCSMLNKIKVVISY